MRLEINNLESSRFGRTIAHVSDFGSDLGEIDVLARQSRIELIFARVEVSNVSLVQHLEAIGFRLMDTLVWYSVEVEKAVVVPQTSELQVRTSRVEDIESIGRIAASAFRNYSGHYHSDQRLDRLAADAAYVDWAERTVTEAHPVNPVLVSCFESQPVGFLSMRGVGSATAEIVLNAVMPAFQGRGVYSQLVSHAIGLAAMRGSLRVAVSTQIDNYGVQRVWSRHGLVHEKSLYTLHKWID